MNNHISTGASTCNNVILVFLEEKSFRETTLVIFVSLYMIWLTIKVIKHQVI